MTLITNGPTTRFRGDGDGGVGRRNCEKNCIEIILSTRPHSTPPPAKSNEPSLKHMYLLARSFDNLKLNLQMELGIEELLHILPIFVDNYKLLAVMTLSLSD